MGVFSFGRSSPAIGLDIGTNLFQAAQLLSASPKPVLANYGAIKVPLGAVSEGEIIDVEAATHSLSQLWRKSNFTQKKVVLGIASQRVVVRLIELPYMEKSELKSAIQYQAQDYIPIPVEEAIVDAQVISEFFGENEEKMMEVLLVAAQKDVVNNAIAAAEGAGLKPMAVDLAAFAVVRSLLGTEFSLPDENEGAVDEAVALLNISSGITNIIVVEQGMPRFARVTPMAGNDFTQAIADVLGLPFDDAEELKIKVGLPPLAGPAEFPEDLSDSLKAHTEAVQNILENQISHFLAEVRRSLDYYLTQATKVKSITRLILSGSGSQLKNIADYLERGLQAEVKKGSPLEKVQVGPKLSADNLVKVEPSLAVCLGLALRELQ